MSNGDDPHAYDGVHGFVYIHPQGKAPEDVVRDVRKLGKPRVYYASTFVGDDYPAFAHISASTLRKLQDLINGPLWEAGVRTQTAIESGYYVRGIVPMGAKRKSPGLIAITRLKVHPHRIDGVLQELGDLDERIGFVGASSVTGRDDILLQVTGGSIDEVKAALGEHLPGIDGVIRTSTAFTDGDRTNALHGDEIPVIDPEGW